MTRKQFLLLPIAALSVGAQPPIVYATKEEQEFVRCFNLWAATGNRNGNTVDIKEIRAWHDTEAAWKVLRGIVRQSYK